MGIDGDIQGDLLRKWAPEAWNNESPNELAAPCVWLDDYLIRFMQLDKDQRYTLHELFQHFWDSVRHDMLKVSRDDKRLWVYGVVCDNRPLVTKFKQRTQAKRVDRSNASDELQQREAPEPYPEGWHLDPELGVVIHTETMVDQEHGIALCNDEVVDPLIDLRRLRVSPGRDAQLWKAFLPLVEEGMADAPISRLFFFDFDGHPKWWGGGGGDEIDHTLRQEQPMGEADPGLIRWVHLLSDKRFPTTKRLRSSDSDLIPLSLLHHQLHHRNSGTGQRIIWHRAKDERVDLTAAAWYVERRMVLSPGDQLTPLGSLKVKGNELAWFAFFCAAAGCDVVFKSDWVARSGLEEVLEAVRLMVRVVREERDTWRTPHELFLFFVRLFYTERWMERCGRTHVPAKWKKPPTREWHTPLSLEALRYYFGGTLLPSDLDLEIAARRMDFCVRYWAGASLGARPDVLDPQLWPRVDRLEKKRKAEKEAEREVKRIKESNDLMCTPTPIEEDIQL